MAKAQGSNELNLLLKSKVVKVKVELDIKGSGLAGQVNKITDFLKNKRVKLKVELQTTGLATQVQGINTFLKDKKVKLGVQLSLSKGDINKQISDINKLIKSNGGIKDIKVAVKIDLKGSASKIKAQLAEVNKEITKFNKNYKKSLEDTQKISNGFGGKKSPSTTSASQDSYAKSLLEAKQYMSQQYGKGLFTSTEMKDANGALTGFIGTLTKANGVVQKIRYDWDANSSSFTPINRTTVTNTEKNVASALKSLRDLDKEIMSLGKGQEKFWQESQSLKSSGEKGSLTKEAVESLRTRIKEEQKLQSKIKEENALLRQQKELIAQINREQKNAKSSSYKNELGNLKASASTISVDDSMAKSKLNDLKSGLNSLKQSYSDNIKKEKELKNATEKRREVLAEIARIEKSKNLTSSGATSKRYLEETKHLANSIKTMEQYNKVRERMSATNRGFKSITIDDSIDKQLAKLQKAMYAYAQQTGRSLSVIEDRYERVSHAVRNNLATATKEVEKFNRLTENDKIKKAYEQRQASVVGNADHTKVNELISAKDNNALKEYISNLNGAQVATMRLVTDSKGISRITAQFASTKKTAKEVTYEVDNVDKKLRQLSTAEVFNANRNLGVFEQLKIAMARVPVWTVAMTAFYGSIRTVQNVTNEILKLDKAMTELRRVADSQIDIDYMFEGAVQLSKELGNNIHDVMASVNELARTFGNFNERQLLAITHTATLMSNVSDLTAQEATESLVGTMNAFNITAEDSIRIVDSMNEVDNNYAISTKQLATGLAKSASTSKTFGVTLEENLGHITAIGAVTMESGNIIGNSLKTIYSRITTMEGVADVFDSVGISVRDSSGDMRDVSAILDDLSVKWHDLTAEERQNIGVKVAGRYQLSRFLALMNNYGMATEATNTALNSQGSATRENAKYLESFEAKINKLKNSFTELSSGIGDAFLTSGLTVGIEMLTKLAEVGISVIDTFGILPIVLGSVGAVLLKFGVFGKLTSSINAGFTAMKVSATSTTGVLARMGAVGTTALTGIKTGAHGASVAVGKFAVAVKTAIRGIMASTLVLAGFVAIGFAIEALVNQISKARDEAEELRKTNETMIKSFRDSGDGMESMFARYKELNTLKEDSKKLTAEESSELEQLSAQFAEQLPMVVDYYDANGVAILKNTDAIRDQIDAVSDLSREQAKLKDMELTKNIEEEAKDYNKIAKEIEKSKKTIKNLEKERYISDEYGAPIEVDNTIAIQKETIKLMGLEAQRRDSMSGTTKLIQEQAVAYLEANGKMVGFGDNQQKLIENFVTYNDKLLISAQANGTFEETVLSMVDMTKEVSDVFTTAYDTMSQGLDTGQLEDLRTQLEAVSASVPEDFLVIDSDAPVQSMERITRGLEEILNVSVHIEDGSTNFEALSKRLQDAGLTAEQSREMIGRLGDQYGNTKIRAEAMSQSIDGMTQSIDESAQSALEAIDPIAKLFGYESGDISAIKSHIETMEVMYQVYGEGAEEMKTFMDSQQQLADFFNVSENHIKDNIHDYNALAGALSNLKIETDEQGGSYLDLSKATSGLTEKQRGMLQAWIDAGGLADVFTGEVDKAKDSVGAYDEELSKGREPFKMEIDTSDVGKAEQAVGGLLTQQENFQKIVSGQAGSIASSMGQIDASAQKVSSISSKLGEVKESTEDVKSSTEAVGKQAEKSYGTMESVVRAKSDQMISTHGRQTTAVNTLKTAFENAQTSAINLNTTVSNSLSGFATYQSRLNSLKSQASALPNLNNFGGVSYDGILGSVASDSIASFSATADGIASSIASGGEGTSGVIKQSAPSFVALHGTSGASKATSSTSTSSKSSTSKSSASKSKTSKSATSTTKKAEELAELYVIDLLDRKRTQYQGTLSKLEARLSALSENSKKFRNGMSQVKKYEESILKLNQKELKTNQERNKSILKRLSALSATNKHTAKQREEYNKLQQEYDTNLKNIAQLKGEIESTIIELRKMSEEIFLDYVGEITARIDKGIKVITDRLDDTDFELEVLDLTDPDNDIAKVDLLATKVRDLSKEQSKYVAGQADLEVQLRKAVARYGMDSDSVKQIIQDMEDYKESWEDVRIEILKTEKEIRELRGETVDELIESTKDYYETLKKNAEKASNTEIENVKKAHKEKMKYYDEESKRLSELYDQRIKQIDDDYNKETYEEEVAEKNKEISKLTEKAKAYSGDTSLEGRKKYAEINDEITQKQKELDDFVKKNKIDKLKEQLNEEKDMLLKQLEDEKTIEEEKHETLIESLEKERDALSEHYEEVSKDEKAWAKLREELMKGNFTVVEQLLKDMGIDLEQLADGTFDTMSEGFSEYSQEVRDFVLEINKMINQVNTMTQSAYGRTTDIKPVENVDLGNPINSVSVSKIITKAYAGEEMISPTADKTQLYNMIQNSGLSEKKMNEIWKKAQAGEELQVPTPQAMTFYNMFEEIIKKSNKLKKFDTGGYTGNNVPSNGALAILDNKELVLNDKQTSHILDSVKLLDKVKSILPNISRSSMEDKFATASEFTNNNYYELNVNIDSLNGDKSGATTVVKEIMKGLKKLGRN